MMTDERAHGESPRSCIYLDIYKLIVMIRVYATVAKEFYGGGAADDGVTILRLQHSV